MSLGVADARAHATRPSGRARNETAVWRSLGDRNILARFTRTARMR